MTRDEIIEMAREAGIVDFRDNDHEQQVQQTVDMLMPFADLVAEREREACAQVCEKATMHRRLFIAAIDGDELKPCPFAEAIRKRGDE